ncbi:MAG TPA: DUF1684 domain-containing protein [Cyclobacteriaceae bacterium]|nr:DUF1684 domain-containing protein [Cyclobacteriaceae bacterium]
MKSIYLIIVIVALISCTPKKAEVDPVAYAAEIEAWHQKRVENLKGPNGWLNVAGLYWLNDGINTFGSGEKNSIVFPAGKIPEFAGFFMLQMNTVLIDVADNVDITSNGQPVNEKIIYHPDSSRAVVLDYGSLQWFVIKRDTKFGIRLRDFKSPAIESFKEIDRYPVDVQWRLEAKFEKADSARTIPITNVLGQTTPQSSPGTLVFAVKDKTYRLDVLDEGGEEYFIIFGDATNAGETYGAGRYVYVKKPDADGNTILDFNKAYNPPCAFTEFATCPLPPKQNILDTEVTSGEKNYSLH